MGGYRTVELFSRGEIQGKKILESIQEMDKSQQIFQLLTVDYSKFFNFRTLTKAQINAILGIEIYLGNKSVLLYALSQKNKKFKKLISYKAELQSIIGDKMHFDVAEKGIKALDELTKRIEFLEKEIAKLYKEIEEDKSIQEYIDKTAIKEWLENL